MSEERKDPGRWRKYNETETDRVRARRAHAFFDLKRAKTKEQLLAARTRVRVRLEESGWTPSQIAQRMAEL